MRYLLTLSLLAVAGVATAAEPFDSHGRLRVAQSGTHLEHADGTPFFVLADTCWTGPALSRPDEWEVYLADRKKKGFTAVQFCMIAPWSAAPADAEGNVSCQIVDGKVVPNEAFYKRLDARLKAVNDAGLLAMPVMVWAIRAKVDLGMVLTADQATQLVKFEYERYKSAHALWVMVGDNSYKGPEADKWKAVGRAVFGDHPDALVTTHPSGTNWPWQAFEGEKWLNVLGYQSGHGDDGKTWKWLHSGPPAEYGKRTAFTRPVMNLEPPYENHNGYQSKKPHSDYNSRRAMYWSLLVHPPAGVTYGGHGVWSWHLKPGEHPTGHQGTGPAKLWKDSLDWPGASQYGYARKLFESLPWTQLRPAQALVKSQPGDADAGQFVAAAATPDRKVIVVYLPKGAEGVQLDDAPVDAKTSQLFDPRAGEFRPFAANWQEMAKENDIVAVLRR